MKVEIKHRFSGKVLFDGKFGSLKLGVVAAVEAKTNLRGANLQGADLRGADLRGAYLWGAKIEFAAWPAATIQTMQLGKLPPSLCFELMRRDAWASPRPELFVEWAYGSGCPLNVGVERVWHFEESAKILANYLDTFPTKRDKVKALRPQMRDAVLVRAICKAKGWGLPDVGGE